MRILKKFYIFDKPELKSLELPPHARFTVVEDNYPKILDCLIVEDSEKEITRIIKILRGPEIDFLKSIGICCSLDGLKKVIELKIYPLIVSLDFDLGHPVEETRKLYVQVKEKLQSPSCMGISNLISKRKNLRENSEWGGLVKEMYQRLDDVYPKFDDYEDMFPAFLRNLWHKARYKAQVPQKIREKIEESCISFDDKNHRLKVAEESGMVGQSEALIKCVDEMLDVAPTNSGVLIRGQSGTGKELMARAIHKLSNRNDKIFIAVNCPAININLESEFFGHVKGAFTGAISNYKGRFEVAHQGTIFLDEICDLNLLVQAKLLRVLEYGTFEKVGSTQLQKVDVRVITATNCDLERAVVDGRFRKDLYYRIGGFQIKLPSLHERSEDIPILLDHFIVQSNKKHSKNVKISQEGIYYLQKYYNWPGNIRELKDAVDRWVIKCKKSEITISQIKKELVTTPRLSSLTEKDLSEAEDTICRFFLKHKTVLDDFKKRYGPLWIKYLNLLHQENKELIQVKNSTIKDRIARLVSKFVTEMDLDEFSLRFPNKKAIKQFKETQK